MADDEQEDDEELDEPEEARRLRAALESIAGLNVQKDLIRARQLGQASFADSEPLFQEIIQQAEKLRVLDWGKLPPQATAPIAQQAEQLVGAIQQVKDLTLNQPDPPAARDNIANLVLTSFQTFQQQTIPYVGYLSWESVNLDELRGAINELVDEARAEVAEITTEIEQRREEADQILTAIRAAAAESGVEHHAETFAQAATRHERNAWWSLAASVVAGVGTIVAAVLLVWLWDVNGDISDASVLQLVVVKGVVLLVGFYATTNAIRMYRSQVHLGVVNRHREDALLTFRAFAQGTDNPEVKDKVLLEATHTIFGPVPTGLIDGREGTSVDILDTVAGLTLRRDR